jgi:hypothetical protein
VTTITEAEFARIVDGIREDRESIIKHNPIGPDDEVLLWMLLSCMVSYLNLDDVETPCFTGRPDAKTYRDAIVFALNDRRKPAFDPQPHLSRLVSQ